MSEEHTPMTKGEAQYLRVEHPDFYYISACGHDDYSVVVFERKLYFQPSPTQIAEYRRNKAVVEQHGGRMILSEHQIAGETPLFTAKDCAAMRAAVETSLSGWQVRGSWNGEKRRAYSVSIERRAALAEEGS